MLLSGHYAKNKKWTNEVWGLAITQDDHCLTVSDDGTLRKWSLNERKLVNVLDLNIDGKGVPL